MNNRGEKQCSSCQVFLPAEYFSKNKAKRSGLNSYCRKCQAAYNQNRNFEPIIKAKDCRKCKTTLSVDDFYPTKRRRDGLSVECKECIKHSRKAYTKNNKDNPEHKQKKKKWYDTAWNKRCLLRHNVTQEEYSALVIKGCAICGGPPTGNRKRYSFDHDHVTGDFRGLLCTKCNSAIGFFNDNIELLQRAINYLNKSRRHLKALP